MCMFDSSGKLRGILSAVREQDKFTATDVWYLPHYAVAKQLHDALET